jgi:adenine-specific DNA-methyltransferase
MAAIHDLLAQVQDEALRARLEQEINRLSKTKKFGLVFEEHLPECTPLYDIPVKRGSTVAKKTGAVSEMYEVNSIKDGIATCYHKVTEEKEEIPVEELVSVAQFGEPIYPYLKPIDSVCNAPDSDLWHTLIEADNYHALQLLEYLYAGKVDCIYIDPPYNTGAKDWKYNNDYVDGVDAYRHSKWLSMMQKRLKIAKNILNPTSSVLVVTIDEKEYLHLGCLLEEMFPEANMQMITSVISRNGTSRENEFSRVEEYIFILRFGEMGVTRTNDNMLSEDGKGVISRVWFNFMRTSTPRSKTKGQFFPIFIDPIEERIVGIGDALLPTQKAEEVVTPEGQVAVLPIRDDNTEATWGAIPETTRQLLAEGYLRVGSFDKKTNRWSIQYVRQGDQKRIKSGEIVIEGKAKDGSLILSPVDASQRIVFPKTVWNRKSHDATEHGTRLLKPLFINTRFSYPKSLYAVADTLRFFVKNNKSAIIVDFFAGSGTTLHAVNLLNAEDDGH